MKRLPVIVAAGCVVALLAAATPAARADIVELTNGRTLQGMVVRENSREVVLAVPWGTVTLKRSQINRIVREDPKAYVVRRVSEAIERRRYVEAIDVIERLDPEAVDDEITQLLSRAYLLRAEQLIDTGFIEQAEQLIERLREMPVEDERIDALGKNLSGRLAQLTKLDEDAQTLLDAGRFEEATPLLGRLRDSQRGRRLYYNRLLGRAAEGRARGAQASQDYEKAAELYDEVLELDPSRLEAIHDNWLYTHLYPISRELGAPDSRPSERRLRQIIRELEPLLDVDPRSPFANYFLAKAAMGLGDYPRAVRHLGIIHGKVNLRYTNPQQIEALGTSAAEILLQTPLEVSADPATRDWQRPTLGEPVTARTEHFVISCYNPEMLERIRRVIDFYRTDLSLSLLEKPPGDWDVPCRITIYPNEAAFVAGTGQPVWAPGRFTWRTRAGRLAEHAIESYHDAPGLVTMVLPHETAHLVLLGELGYPNVQVTWFHEGFAVRAEPAFKHHFYREMVAERAAQGQLIDVEALTSARGHAGGENVGLFYSESFLLFDMLQARVGMKAMLEMEPELRERPFFDVMKARFGWNRRAFIRRWDAYVESVSDDPRPPRSR